MLDAPVHDPLGDEDLAAYAAVLEEVRVELEHRADLVRDGADVPTAGVSFGKNTSIAGERFEDVAIHGQAVLQMTAIEQALARIDEGTFGICPGCNRAIPIDRLNVLPWAATCVACA
jgi:RNA polymerase-binding transcription factor DksA